MKAVFIIASMAATMAVAQPALAGGRGGSLVGGVFAPITTNVGKVSALNNIAVLSGNSIANGNKATVNAPVNVSRNGILNGLLGGGRGHGCGCN